MSHALKSAFTLTLAILTSSCGNARQVDNPAEHRRQPPTASSETGQEGASGKTALATFAGGCFWCMEKPFDDLDGVISTTSGYSGGTVPNPSYEQVSAGRTGHAEVVQVVYDPDRISYEELLYVFWRNVDPLTSNRQFCDSGSQYRSGIFVHDDAQRKAAEDSLRELSSRFSSPIVTEIVDFDEFYPAEDYHQDYYATNPIRYRFYRSRCGRDQRLAQVWGDEAGGHTE
ncbi:MAG: peptide-methionine (S)-S-oxide reductase MsrA [Acidobacteria bacterium]|nr:peptide-methionine (S)-S-oxide reductase MsrA [Acidobacteriota bacterium]